MVFHFSLCLILSAHAYKWFTIVTCHFYLLLFPLFDLSFDFKIFSLLLSSVFHLPCLYVLLPMIFPNTLCLSVFCLPFRSYFNSSFTYFHILYSALCSFVPFLLLFFHHLFIIPCLPFLTLSTQHLIPCDSVSHLFTFSILHCLPYHSESCSIKFLPICTYLLPQLVIVIYLCKNTTHLCLLCLSKLRTPLFLGKGATHKLKPSPPVSLCHLRTLHLIPIHHSIPCSGLLLRTLLAAYLHL